MTTTQTVGTAYDSGLQPERTALAWRRTVLTLIAGALASSRLLSPELGPAATAVSSAIAVIGLLSLGLLHKRHRATVAALTNVSTADTPLRDGRLPAAVATAAIGLGGAALVYGLIHWA